MATTIPDNAQSERRTSVAICVVALHALLGLGLIAGFDVRVALPVPEAMTLVTLRPPPVPAAPPKRLDRPREAAAPPGRRADPVPLVAPPPLVEVPPPPQLLLAAPIAAAGIDTSAGIATAGTGVGTGGTGTGPGDGGEGDGGGTHSQFRSGRIKASDYPLAAEAAGAEGTVVARVIIGPDGRVASCTIAETSGSSLLDDTTCRLITKRFRYKPGRDAAGRPVIDEWVEEQVWRLDRREG